MKENQDENISLRSEKIRHLLSEIPVKPLLAGIIVMIVIVLAIIISVTVLPYPHSAGETILEHIFSSNR